MGFINPAVAMLSPKYREIARRLLAGETQADIARAMGLSTHAISVIVNKNPLFKRAMSEMQCKADQVTFDLLALMRTHSQEAAETVLAAMRDETAPLSTRRLAAKDVLGYAGYSNTNTPQVNISQTNLTFEQLLAKEMGKVDAIKEAEVLDHKDTPLKELAAGE